MAFDAHKNLASSTVATPPSPPGTGSTLVVAAGQGTRFPAAPFDATVSPSRAARGARGAHAARAPRFPPAPCDATVWPSAAAPTLASAEIVRVASVGADTFQ